MTPSATGWTEDFIRRTAFAIVLVMLAAAPARGEDAPQAQPLPPPVPAIDQTPLQPQLPVLPVPQPIELEESTRWSKTLERISTGVVRVPRTWAAVDAGLIINPDGLANQIEGGVVQSVSWTLMEEVRFDKNGILAQDFVSYPIITMPEAPKVEIELINRPGERAAGAGEGSQGPAVAAVARPKSVLIALWNAVLAARRGTRSCGRRGPARLGSMVARSSRIDSE